MILRFCCASRYAILDVEKGEIMIRIIAVGKLKEKALSMLVEEYTKRLRPFTKLEIVEVADESAPMSNSDASNARVKEKEGERILAKINTSKRTKHFV